MNPPATEDELLSRRLGLEGFRAIAGEVLEVLDPRTLAVVATLRVHAVREGASTPAMLQYAVTLRGPAEPALAQGTYRMRHPTLGDYAIFVTPVARTEAGFDYEACFAHAP